MNGSTAKWAIAAMWALLVALGGWNLTNTVTLKEDVAAIKARLDGLERPLQARPQAGLGFTSQDQALELNASRIDPTP